MNKARQEVIQHIWEQYEAAKMGLDREMLIRSQEMISEWAAANGFGDALEDESKLEEMHAKLAEDEEMVEKSNALAEEIRKKFWTLIYDHVIPAIDESKINCKDGIIVPDANDVSNLSSGLGQGSGIIIAND